MSQQPIVLTLPHHLGKAEALKRLKAGFQHTEAQSAGSFVAFQNKWSGDHLDFRASILGQTTTGTVDVAEDHVRLEFKLPWLLSLLANRAKVSAPLTSPGLLISSRSSATLVADAPSSLLFLVSSAN